MALFSKKKTKKEKIFKDDKKMSQKIGFLSSLNLYTRLIADKIDKGVTDKPDTPLQDGKFYYSTNRIYTKYGVKKMFFLYDFPPELNRGFVTDLRKEVSRAVNNYNTTHGLDEFVYVNLIIDGSHYNLDLGNRQIQGRWQYFAKEYERISEKAGNRSLKDELASDRYPDSVRRKVNSFLYIKEAKEDYNAAFFKTNVILEFVASSNDILQEAENALRSFTFQSSIRTKEVFIQTNEYNRSFSPMRSTKYTLLRKMFEGDVWADDTISSFSLSTHGYVGDKIGIYHGVDIQSKNILAIDLSKGSDAKNILLTASTGEGKSNCAKMLYTFIYPMPEYATVIFDYEGTEYTALGRITKAKFVGLGVGDGRYVNTMVIGDLTGNKEIDSNLKIEAMTATERVFNTLVDEDKGMTRQELALFNDCLNAVYRDFGVSEDPSTWHNSKDCTFFHIYSKLLQMKENPDVVREYGMDAILDFIIALKPYFEQGGIRSHWFKEPISLQEIVDSNNVIFNFGMGGTDESMVDSKYLALRQMFASYITTLLASKNKVKGIKTVIFLEELQRYLKHRFSGEIVAAFTSGGRKMGMIVYLITNAPSEFISLADTDDEENQVGKNVSIVMSNITMQIIGALWRRDMDTLIDQFNLENARGILYQLSEIKENNKKNDTLKYCFFIKYQGQSTLVRMLSHPALEQLPIYETSVKKQDENGKEVTVKMNVGEEAIKKSIDLAVQREVKNVNQSWRERMKDSKSSSLWE